jgi:hypothetical protein
VPSTFQIWSPSPWPTNLNTKPSPILIYKLFQDLNILSRPFKYSLTSIYTNSSKIQKLIAWSKLHIMQTILFYQLPNHGLIIYIWLVT